MTSNLVTVTQKSVKEQSKAMGKEKIQCRGQFSTRKGIVG